MKKRDLSELIMIMINMNIRSLDILDANDYVQLRFDIRSENV